MNAEIAATQAQSVWDQATACVQPAKRRLQILGPTPDKFAQQLTLSARLTGRITELTVAPGEFRNDLSASLITIADLSVWIAADVPESEIRFVHPGEGIEIELTAFPGETPRANFATGRYGRSSSANRACVRARQHAGPLAVSVLLIFVLLFQVFGSVRSAFLILLNVPFALIGGIGALLLTGIHLSVSAAIGFIALFGQAVLNGVVMVSYFNELRDEGLSPYQSVVQGALVRLRTVLMTSLLAMLGLLPMALSHGIGSEVQRPLATVIIGGLISATGLTLILLPIIYLALEGRRVKPSP